MGQPCRKGIVVGGGRRVTIGRIRDRDRDGREGLGGETDDHGTDWP